MSVLPLIDALILGGWSSLMVGFVLKGIDISTSYRPNIAGLTAMDFLLFAIVCMLFALTLAARTWVKSNEPRILRGALRPPLAPPEAEDGLQPVEASPNTTSAGRQMAAGRRG